jgi:hypothetical protein
MQGSWYDSGSILSRGILVALMVMSLYYWGYTHLYYKIPRILKMLDVFILLLSIYGFFYILDSTAPSLGPRFYYIKNTWMSLLPIYAFYHYGKKGYYSESNLQIFSLLWLGVFIASYFLSYQTQLAESISGRDEFTNNTGYSFLSLMPLLVFWNNRKVIQMGLVLVTMYFIITAMKRGAIIIGAVVVVYFIVSIYKTVRKNQRWLVILIMATIVVGAVWMVQDMLTNSTYFEARIEATKEGNSSGRDILFGGLIDAYFHKTTIIQFFFGRGANETIGLVGNYAHNDWLELATDQGLLGIIVYAFFFVTLWKASRQRKHLPQIYMSMMMFSHRYNLQQLTH